MAAVGHVHLKNGVCCSPQHLMGSKDKLQTDIRYGEVLRTYIRAYHIWIFDESKHPYILKRTIPSQCRITYVQELMMMPFFPPLFFHFFAFRSSYWCYAALSMEVARVRSVIRPNIPTHSLTHGRRYYEQICFFPPSPFPLL